MALDEYGSNRFAQEIFNLTKQAGFGSRFDVLPVIDDEIVVKIVSSSIKGLDYRSKMAPTQGFDTAYHGLAFDPINVRSQAVAILDGDKPIGLMTQVIAPKVWTNAQRYFENVGDGVRVRDFRSISGEGLAEYTLIPAWTVLDENYRYPKSIIRPAFKLFVDTVDLVTANAPDGTYIEAVAAGKADVSQRDVLLELSRKELGTFIPEKDLPFDISTLGINSEGAMASVNMAKRINLERVENLGSARSLGPVFVRRLK